MESLIGRCEPLRGERLVVGDLPPGFKGDAFLPTEARVGVSEGGVEEAFDPGVECVCCGRLGPRHGPWTDPALTVDVVVGSEEEGRLERGTTSAGESANEECA